MRSEHRTTGDEFDLSPKWRRVLCYLSRPGVAKSIKSRSHRIDRRNIRNVIREQLN